MEIKKIISSLFDTSSLDMNLTYYVRKRYMYIGIATCVSVFSSIETKSFMPLLLFLVLVVFLLANILYVIILCKKKKLKILEAECIEYVRRNLKERELRSYYIFNKGNLYYKIYTCRKKYVPGNTAVFYLTDNDLAYESDDTFNVISFFLEIKQKTKRK